MPSPSSFDFDMRDIIMSRIMSRPGHWVLLLLLLAGCGGIGRSFDNFTAYYNKFYNAEKSYVQGVKTFEKENEPVDQNVFLPLFTAPDRASNVKEFDSAIKKGADVLRSHPDSKWVDDALLLIGKSYFYMQNYVGAEQKFREVITELDARKKSAQREDEARFWLARTLIASGAFEEATLHLQESLAREGLSGRWGSMLHLALGELYVKRQAWAEAAAELEAGLEKVDENDLGARAQFLLGQVYEKMEQYEGAIEAYKGVQRYNPLYELTYAAQVSAIRVEGLHGDAGEALREVRRMQRDDKHYTNRGELAYLEGRIDQATGQADQALGLYRTLLYDSDADISKIRGRVHYALGELYHDAYKDYFLAAAHFDTARVAMPSGTLRGARTAGSTEQNYAAAAITDSEEMAEIFGSFAQVQQEVNQMDSLLYLGSLDEAAFEEAVLKLRQKRAEELAAQRREMERQQTQQRFAQINEEGRLAEEDSGAVGDASETESSGAGFLFHKDPGRVQEGRLSFIQRWGKRPLRPNWRRKEALSNHADSGAAGADSLDQTLDADPEVDAAEAGLPVVDVSAVPRDSASQAQMRVDRALKRYELGNVLFLSMNQPDSAAAWYRMVIEQDAEQPVAMRAYYALAEVQRSLGDTLAARRLYQQVLQRYPEAEFAGRIREQLDGPQVITVPVEEEGAAAEAAYAESYRAWQRGSYSRSLHDMLQVAGRYRDTEVAPKALLAAASIYAEWAGRDSLDLFAPLPVDLPDSFLVASGLVGREGAGGPTRQDSTDLIPVTPGTEATGQDSLATALDSLGTTAPLPTVASDSLVAAADTPDPGLDSLATATDRLATIIPPAEGASDSLALNATPETGPLRLETLYALLIDRYSESPQAARSRALIQVLQERRAQAAQVADSAAVDSLVGDATPTAGLPEAVDTLLTDTLLTDTLLTDTLLTDTLLTDTLADARADSLADTAIDSLRNAPADSVAEAGGDPDKAGAQKEGTSVLLRRRLAEQQTSSVRPDSAQTKTLPAPERDAVVAADSLASEPEEAGPPGLAGAEPVRPSEGGWTLVVASPTDQRAAEMMAQQTYRLGYRVGVSQTSSGTTTHYRVLVGQFASQEEALAARQQVIDRLGLKEDPWVLSLSSAP